MATNLSPKDIVRTGYDSLGAAYRQHFAEHHRANYPAWIQEFCLHVPAGGTVVELGCADGLPVGAELAARYCYVGVEFSEILAEAARRHVPSATILAKDMTQVTFARESVDGVVALYSIVHVPIEEQPALFRNISSWLRPGAPFMTVVGSMRWAGTEEDWVLPGTTMYWSHGSGDDYESLCREVGLEVRKRSFVPEGTGGHTFMLLIKPN